MIQTIRNINSEQSEKKICLAKMISCFLEEKIDLLIHKLNPDKVKQLIEKLDKKYPRKQQRSNVSTTSRMEYAKNREAVSVYFSLFIPLQMRFESDLLSCFLNEKKLP